MKIIRKQDEFTEAMLNDMFAEKMLEKYYEEKYGNENNLFEEFLSLAVLVYKDTGIDYLCDIDRFDNYEDCKNDDKINRSWFRNHTNSYLLFITGKRIEFLKDSPLYIVIEAEAIEG